MSEEVKEKSIGMRREEFNEILMAHLKGGLGMVMLRVHKCPTCAGEGKKILPADVKWECCGGVDVVSRFGRTMNQCYGHNCQGMQKKSYPKEVKCTACDGRGWLWRDEFIAGSIEKEWDGAEKKEA